MKLTIEVDGLAWVRAPEDQERMKGRGWVLLRRCHGRDAVILCRRGWRWLLRVLPYHAYFNPGDFRAAQARAGFFLIGLIADTWALCIGRWFARIQLPFLRSISVYAGGARGAIGVSYGMHFRGWAYRRAHGPYRQYGVVKVIRDGVTIERPLLTGRFRWRWGL